MNRFGFSPQPSRSVIRKKNTPLFLTRISKLPMKTTTNDHAENLSNLQGAAHAARILGSLGGKAGTGKAKARTKAQCRKAALKRWSKRPTL